MDRLRVEADFEEERAAKNIDEENEKEERNIAKKASKDDAEEMKSPKDTTEFSEMEEGKDDSGKTTAYKDNENLSGVGGMRQRADSKSKDKTAEISTTQEVDDKSESQKKGRVTSEDGNTSPKENVQEHTSAAAKDSIASEPKVDIKDEEDIEESHYPVKDLDMSLNTASSFKGARVSEGAENALKMVSSKDGRSRSDNGDDPNFMGGILKAKELLNPGSSDDGLSHDQFRPVLKESDTSSETSGEFAENNGISLQNMIDATTDHGNEPKYDLVHGPDADTPEEPDRSEAATPAAVLDARKQLSGKLREILKKGNVQAVLLARFVSGKQDSVCM